MGIRSMSQPETVLRLPAAVLPCLWAGVRLQTGTYYQAAKSDPCNFTILL